jgi:hypothetical protein
MMNDEDVSQCSYYPGEKGRDVMRRRAEIVNSIFARRI